ncbi:MAG: DDE-type integrase/transposase/recombinase, partial [Rubrobacter sp.]|nr:DDE-type integrase/transposase/recombinase [Rubrobacter sp.]
MTERLKRGPKTELGDDDILVMIKEILGDCPFSGEGHRKVTARLRRDKGVQVGRKRVLRIMRHNGLLAPQRKTSHRKARAHDGTIIPGAPDLMWGADATMAYTKRDGWVWAFCAVDHFSAEAWVSVAKRGDRFAALEPIYDAVTDRFGRVDNDVARGIALRHDWGPQYTSGHFQGSVQWLGIEDSPAFAGEPPCNGCAERFIRTLKEQCLWVELYDDLEELRRAVIEFMERYNSQWLIERHGHMTPREAYAAAVETIA